jgi:ComF family protein
MLRKNMKYAGNKIADFLLPPLCPATGEPVDTIGMVDPQYWSSLNFINAPFCDRCGTPFEFEASHLSCGSCIDDPPVYNKNRSALTYDDSSREIILRFKHGDQTHAVKAFTPWLKQSGRELLETADIIVPVPLHTMRLIKRRYNQSDLIGRELTKHYPDITYIPDALIRVKNTVPQGHKKATDRKSNVSRAFKTNPKYNIEGKNILIIDDVYTTGATLNECAKTLYREGAMEVNCLTLARAVKN